MYHYFHCYDLTNPKDRNGIPLACIILSIGNMVWYFIIGVMFNFIRDFIVVWLLIQVAMFALTIFFVIMCSCANIEAAAENRRQRQNQQQQQSTQVESTVDIVSASASASALEAKEFQNFQKHLDNVVSHL